MKKILGYLKDYFVTTDKRILALSTLFTALSIFINYYCGLNRSIGSFSEFYQYLSWYLVFLFAFSFAYLMQAILLGSKIFRNRKFILLLLIAPAIFAWKMSFDVEWDISNDIFKNTYWNQVIYWPFKLVVLTIILLIICKLFDQGKKLYGVNFENFNATPYLLMLLIMIPLIAAASTQHDFLSMYPKLKNIEYLSYNSGFYKLLYELSYGSDFFSIELFFRGFLILAFAKWVGKDAILPMAIFYCTIHFGKPLGECISSFFGGIILGVVIYHTKTIFGGLIVHLGIAWLMELGGYIGNQMT